MTLHKWGKFSKGSKPQTKETLFASISRSQYWSKKKCLKFSEFRSPIGSKLYVSVDRNLNTFTQLGNWHALDGYGDVKGYAIVTDCVKGGSEDTNENYYYIFGDIYTKTTEYISVKGSILDTVTSTNRNAYPNDGEKDNYWYVYPVPGWGNLCTGT